MNIDWKSLNRAETAKAMEILTAAMGDQMPPAANIRLRGASLDFYPGFQFYELTDMSTTPARQAYALHRTESDAADPELYLLDGSNTPIYTLNQTGPIELTEERVIPYVSFFFASVAGPHGLMPVIERFETQGDEPVDDETKAAMESVKDIVPPKMLEKDANGHWVVAAALLFQNAVFKTEITVEASGLLEVTKHALALAAGEAPPTA